MNWSPDHRKAIDLLGIPVDIVNPDKLSEVVSGVLATKQKSIISYVNIHTMNTAYKSSELREFYRNVRVNYCDGAGVVWGARLAGKHLPGRMTAASFIFDLCKKWENSGVSVFFLGGAPGVAEKAETSLLQQFPDLKIVGTHHGYFPKEGTENSDILKIVNRARPDILFVGFGTPMQETWVRANFDRLEVPVIWPIGALVDYLGGGIPRCPQWMQNHSLEWLFRFFIEPKRLFYRYIIGNPLFFIRVIKYHRFKKSVNAEGSDY